MVESLAAGLVALSVYLMAENLAASSVVGLALRRVVWKAERMAALRGWQLVG